MEPMIPAAAASEVVTSTKDTGPGSADSTEPPLKPNQPSHSRNTPMVSNGMLWPMMPLTLPPTYLPRRGPITMIPANAPHPPTEWTRVEPAKS
jgi:hypothetical protein